MNGWRHCLLLVLCLLALPALAEELIEDFSVRIEVQGDGSLLVTERISVQARGQEIRRGIYRDLPVRYQLDSGLEAHAPIELLEVLRDGRPEPFHEENLGAYRRYYLGSAKHLLNDGRYEYQLRYRTERQLLHHPERDELYWNVTGNGWSFPIRAASVEVQLPAGARIQNWAAYTGAAGEQGQAHELLVLEEARFGLRTTAPLAPYQGLTIALDWPAGLVARPSAEEQALQGLRDNLGLALGGGLLLGLLLFYLRSWWKVGRDPRKGLIIPLFAPPEGMGPACAGYLWHKGFSKGFDSARALAISITELAIGGRLQLEDDARKGRYSLSRTGAESPWREEQAWLNTVFANAEAPPLQLGGSYQSRLGEGLSELTSLLLDTGKQWFSRNYGRWTLGLLWALLGCGLMLFFSLHSGDEMGQAFAGLLFALAFGGPALGMLVMAWRQPSWKSRLFMSLAGLMFLWPAPVGLWLLTEVVNTWVLLLLAAYVLLVLLFFFLLPAPTQEGRRLLDQLEGYRNYLQLAEGDSLARAGAAPAMSIALYEQHLPYAMALGVEEQWTARFSEALASGLIDPAQRNYQPRWYRSREPLSAKALGSSLAGGLSRATASTSRPPSSSSSGGSSGGGSSSGGRGGGGGGGW